MPVLPKVLLIWASVAVAFGADTEPLWGPIQDDLQLGIAMTSEREPGDRKLLVSLRNAGNVVRNVTLGTQGDAGPIYSVALQLVPTDRTPEQWRSTPAVFDLNALRSRPSSIPSFIGVYMKAGETRVLSFPLRQLISVVSRQDVALASLMSRAQYGLRASIELGRITLETPTVLPIR